MTVVKSYGSLSDAYLAKSILEAAGVEADILDEYVAGNAPYLLGPSGIRLSVADEDAAAAREALGLPPLPDPAPRKSGTAPVWAAIVVFLAGLTILIAGMRQYHPFSADGTYWRDIDRNHDGKTDVRIEFDSRGRPVRAFLDNNFDGIWDVRITYEDGVIKKMESDPGFDGTFPMTCDYENGVPVLQIVRPGGHGAEISRTEFKDGVIARIWRDNDRCGHWQERIDYDALGRETARVALHP